MRYNLTLMDNEIRLYHVFNGRFRNYIAFHSQSYLEIA